MQSGRWTKDRDRRESLQGAERLESRKPEVAAGMYLDATADAVSLGKFADARSYAEKAGEILRSDRSIDTVDVDGESFTRDQALRAVDVVGELADGFAHHFGTQVSRPGAGRPQGAGLVSG